VGLAWEKPPHHVPLTLAEETARFCGPHEFKREGIMDLCADGTCSRCRVMDGVNPADKRRSDRGLPAFS